MPSVERGRACVSGYARLPPELPRATCSSVFLQTRGCPCNSSFGGISPVSPFFQGASNLALGIVGAQHPAPLQEYLFIPCVRLALPAVTTTGKPERPEARSPVPARRSASGRSRQQTGLPAPNRHQATQR